MSAVCQETSIKFPNYVDYCIRKKVKSKKNQVTEAARDACQSVFCKNQALLSFSCHVVHRLSYE